MFFWVFPRRQIVVGRRFGTLCQFHLQRLGSKTSAKYNLTPVKYPKEHIQYSNHGESLKSRIPKRSSKDKYFYKAYDSALMTAPFVLINSF